MEGITISGLAASLIINIINIIVMFVIVRALVYKPVKAFMANRSARVSNDRIQAEQMRAEAERIQAESEKTLASADQAAEEKKREIVVEANKQAQQMMEEAKAQAAEFMRATRDKMELERQKTMEQLQSQFGDLAIDIASRVLEREVKKSDNQDIIDKYFDKVG